MIVSVYYSVILIACVFNGDLLNYTGHYIYTPSAGAGNGTQVAQLASEPLTPAPKGNCLDFW